MPLARESTSRRATGRRRLLFASCIAEMAVPQHPDPEQWRIGGSGEVAWINDATTGGFTIASAVPPIFALMRRS